MLTDKLKNQLHLHFIVFIWGFTAILGALISVSAIPLVFLRVVLASMTLAIFFLIKKMTFKIDKVGILKLLLGGVLIALHWITFFHAIKVSNISTTLVTMSTSAVFVALFDPIFNNRKILSYEVFLAALALVGFVIIFQISDEYRLGVFYALTSAILLAFFSILNGKNIKKYKAGHIAFYELFFASIFIFMVLLIQGDLINSISKVSPSDLLYLLILATICTAYPFVVVTNLLHKMSPFTIVLTNNLEPVYGIVLAILIFGSKEKMDMTFYIGALFIFSAVILNGLMKLKAKYNS